jgi:translation initiation factor 1
MASKRDDEYRVVYSTDQGNVCPECQKSKGSCTCAKRRRATIVGDGNVKVRRETKGRGGKTVTTITGLAMNGDQLEALQKELKRLCGAGGAVKDGVIEVQGDHCEAVLRDLEKRGIKAKRAGG